MECFICTVRSSTGYCAVCRTLICDECGTRCEVCGKAFCPTHSKPARGGHVVCDSCSTATAGTQFPSEPRSSGGGGLFTDDEPYVPYGQSANAEAMAREQARIKRGQRDIRPWRVSLKLSLAGLAVVLLLLLFPGLRTIPIGARSSFPTAFIAVIPLLLAVGISFAGFFEPLPRESKWMNTIGIGIAAIGIVLAFVTVRAAPASPDAVRDKAAEALKAKDPHELTPEERQKWRRKMLERYENQ